VICLRGACARRALPCRAAFRGAAYAARSAFKSARRALYAYKPACRCAARVPRRAPPAIGVVVMQRAPRSAATVHRCYCRQRRLMSARATARYGTSRVFEAIDFRRPPAAAVTSMFVPLRPSTQCTARCGRFKPHRLITDARDGMKPSTIISTPGTPSSAPAIRRQIMIPRHARLPPLRQPRPLYFALMSLRCRCALRHANPF